jgi:acetyl-CoA carboxylase biotin carboxyl carrier protein
MTTQIKSEIAGSVWKVEVQSGAAVAEADVILIMESMKMEIPVEAPTAGVVTVLVSEGQSVQEGDVLAEVD